ncbi:thiol reductant ABC exporter subunit CydD [Actinomadura sp. NBRC 104425]|uniref:thiol reductant ABC exporter subunit CydD n=1 Tax=Actinomadura sp. NBRC 104425 TaxID=3032204 RepID=UPI0025572AB2|nr:thiol reductant ABC exporter subunit CydD [Actinomadura sp. NBRC 104425]
MERRLVGWLPRRVPVVLVAVAVAQAVLVVVQADALARAVAGLDARLLIVVGAAVAGRAVLAWVGSDVAGRAAAQVKARLRTALLARPSAGAGGARVTLLTRGLDAVDPFFAGYVPQLVAACVVPPVVLARLGAADWVSAVVVAVTVPLVPVFGALVGARTAQWTGRQWGLLRRLGGHFRDVVAGLSTLRAFGRAGHQSVVVRRLAEEHRRATMGALRVAFLSSLVVELVCSLSVALVAVPVGLRLMEGRLELAKGLLVLLLAPEVYAPLRALGSRFHASAEGVAVAGEVFGVLDASAAAQGGRPVPRREVGGAPEIVLEEVTVRYPGADRPALAGVSLRVAPGERVAVTGPSGAGKSTLLAVLAGLVVPESGRVLVDGVPLEEMDVAQWRSRLGWVPQRPHLFAASVADNIRLGVPDADAGQVRAAACAAGAEEFIEALPEGYATVLGEGGAGLSAGQRQRLAIARAFVTRAPVMLLDEPTARLDVRSEGLLVQAVRRLLEGRSAVMVAHRPALLGAADRVVRLVDGRLVSDASPAAGTGASEGTAAA